MVVTNIKFYNKKLLFHSIRVWFVSINWSWKAKKHDSSGQRASSTSTLGIRVRTPWKYHCWFKSKRAFAVGVAVAPYSNKKSPKEYVHVLKISRFIWPKLSQSLSAVHVMLYHEHLLQGRTTSIEKIKIAIENFSKRKQDVCSRVSIRTTWRIRRSNLRLDISKMCRPFNPLNSLCLYISRV